MTIIAYRDRTTGEYPIRPDEVRRRAGNIAYGDEPTPDVLDVAHVDGVEAVAQPAFNPDTEIVTEDKPKMTFGTWRQQWIVSPKPPPPVPNSISDRQFAEILAISGMITREEARAWVKIGEVPQQLAQAVDQIPDDDIRFSAQMHLEGATTFLRDNVFTSMLGMLMNRNSAELDQLWIQGSTL